MNPDETPEQKFANELYSVFNRWYEESDLDDVDMEEVALQVIDNFCGRTVDFAPGPDFFDEAS
jgi:hypothetical protein